VADFEAARATGESANGLVTLRKRWVDGGRIGIDVVLADFDVPVSGIALQLTYPATFSKFIGCEDGDLFDTGTCYFDEPSSGSGEVSVGRSVLGSDQATAVVGARVVVSMVFLVFGQGDDDINIEAQNLGGGDASAVFDADGVPIPAVWVAGTLRGS